LSFSYEEFPFVKIGILHTSQGHLVMDMNSQWIHANVISPRLLPNGHFSIETSLGRYRRKMIKTIFLEKCPTATLRHLPPKNAIGDVRALSSIII